MGKFLDVLAQSLKAIVAGTGVLGTWYATATREPDPTITNAEWIALVGVGVTAALTWWVENRPGSLSR